MKILHISTSDIEGGAARSAYRLHNSLQTVGVHSSMLVRAKNSSDNQVYAEKSLRTKLGPMTERYVLRGYPNREQTSFSAPWLPDVLARAVQRLSPSIVNLHWVGTGFVKIETLKQFQQPLVWTFHDMWAFTGGCHYDQDCGRYKTSCGQCPQLNSGKEADLSRRIWQRKVRAWEKINLTIVTPSRWMMECAAASSLLQSRRIEVIPYGLDTERYKPQNRTFVRSLLGLPPDKQLILFSSMSTKDRRKGFHLLQSTLKILEQSGLQDQIELVVLGASQASDAQTWGIKTHYMGRQGDDISLALIYAAVDVFVAPSLQDNLPNTVLEAIACGTPCVAFKIGGMPDMIEHGYNGYLAKPYEVADLAKGIEWVLDSERHLQLCDQARQKVEQCFTLERQGQQYHTLYTELLENVSAKS
jgi:glycosyltransferase involved in cell wall biosynthesis